MENIKNKVNVITGASSGIGAATARKLSKLGAKLVLAARWLLKRRLQAAYDAISLRNKMPIDIDLDLGFEDIAHFSRTFKNEFGFNASQLLKSAKAENML